MNNDIRLGLITGIVVTALVYTLVVIIIDIERTHLKTQQDHWIEQGVLQYNPKTGEIEAACK